MKAESPVIPGENWAEIIIAKDQDEYENLPAIVLENGKAILCRFVFSEEEKQQIAETGNLYLTIWTFGKPMQPILPQTDKPILRENESSKVAGKP